MTVKYGQTTKGKLGKQSHKYKTQSSSKTLTMEWLIPRELEEVTNNSGHGDNDVSGKKRKGIPCQRKSICQVQEA